MPYINEDDRIDIIVKNRDVKTAGELNFLFSYYIRKYLENEGCTYQKLNDVVGALEGAKLELYRRVVAPYETKKIAENGDVY